MRIPKSVFSAPLIWDVATAFCDASRLGGWRPPLPSIVCQYCTTHVLGFRSLVLQTYRLACIFPGVSVLMCVSAGDAGVSSSLIGLPVSLRRRISLAWANMEAVVALLDGVCPVDGSNSRSWSVAFKSVQGQFISLKCHSKPLSYGVPKVLQRLPGLATCQMICSCIIREPE